MPVWTKATAASRAAVTVCHAPETRSGIRVPVKVIHVMSAKTAAGVSSLPHRSSSSTSSATDGPMPGRGRQVVRVAGVLLGGDDRRAVADEPFIGEQADHLGLDFELVQRPAGRERAAQEGERPVLDAIQPDRGVAMRRRAPPRPRPPRSAVPGRPTRRPRPPASAACRSCPRRRGTGRGWRTRASTPSRRGAGRPRASSSPSRARRARRRLRSRRAGHRDCAARWRARASGAFRRGGSR